MALDGLPRDVWNKQKEGVRVSRMGVGRRGAEALRDAVGYLVMGRPL